MLTHIDSKNQPQIVNITEKDVSARRAVAQSLVKLPSELHELFANKSEFNTKKGPVFQTAIIAATMAVKKCSELIPLCHPLPIEDCQINIQSTKTGVIKITCEVATTHKTGVEMEALTGASIAALTIYDMCKALSPEIKITETKLLEKTGGKRDFRSEDH